MIKIKVKELISKLKGYEEFEIEFGIASVNLDLKEPQKYFPYTETVTEIVIDDICYSEKEILLGYKEKRYFHRVTEME